MKAIIALMFFLSLFCDGCTKSILVDSQYFGQTPPDQTPKLFAPDLLVPSGHWAGERVAISADGKELYFSDCIGGCGIPNSSIKLKFC